MDQRQSPRRTDPAPTHVALLRGINVGGKHVIPMAGLVAIFSDAGCQAVQSWIQSGNVVFAASASLARRIPALITSQIGKQFGFEPALVVRSKPDWARIIAANPYLTARADLKTLHVGFLAKAVAPSRAASIDPDRSPGDELTVRRTEIYLRLGNGVGKTKYTSPYLDSTLGTTCTIRNWNTVMKLAAMLGLD